jgi:hypothetical protein
MNLRHEDFPNFGGFSLTYISSIVLLALFIINSHVMRLKSKEKIQKREKENFSVNKKCFVKKLIFCTKCLHVKHPMIWEEAHKVN